MAANPMCSMAAAQAGLDAILAKLNVGGVAGTIQIFSGAMPATAETADSGTKLSTLTFSVTSFAGSTDPGSTGLATATANSITSDSNAIGSASVTAGYFRAKDKNGVVVLQGTCGTSAADMILNTTTIPAGSQVSITSYVVTLPDGSGAD